MKITDLFAPLERLIEEHGSSTIQGKHIAFLREQLSVLKERFVEAQRANEQLESKLQACESKRKELQAENSNLKQEIKRLKDTGPRTGSWGSKPPIEGLR
jgi:septal ring factor EnvC (AmiA/AmiB activator)